MAHALLGRQDAPCAGSRARRCPVPGHPCLDGVEPAEVVDAIDRLLAETAAGPPGAGFVSSRLDVLDWDEVLEEVTT